MTPNLHKLTYTTKNPLMDLDAPGWETVSDTMLRAMESEGLNWDPCGAFGERQSPLRVCRTRIIKAKFSADGVTTGDADHSEWLTHTEHRDGVVVSNVAFRARDGALSAEFRDLPKGELTLDTAAGGLSYLRTRRG